MNIYTQLSEW